MHDIERRATATGTVKIETRDGAAPKMIGHAAVFNSLSEDLGGFREMILPGAFAKALTDDVRLLINHDGLPLARTVSGTLRLSEDQRGLVIEADLEAADPDVQLLLPKMARGDLNQMSFGFSVRPGGQEWAMDDNGGTIRTLSDLRLFDVSVVTFPAYPTTDVAVRELRTWQGSLRAPAPIRLMQALQDQASI